MDKVRKIESLDPERDGRGGFEYPNSPEFEFWMVRNPSLPQPNMVTADELFFDGVLLPLDLVSVSVTPSESASPVSAGCVSEPESAEGEVPAGAQLTAKVAASEPATGSKRWKDIFKKSESKPSTEITDQKTNKKREKKSSSSASHASSSELNINIWPFSRSRSAGTSGTRPKIPTSARKVSSAPCSRSNSGGESKSRKWPASPARAGVHIGRSSPVWQIRRGGSATMPRPTSASDGVDERKSVIHGGRKLTILKGCKQRGAAVGGGDAYSRIGTGGSDDGTGVVSFFNLRSLFSKKVY